MHWFKYVELAFSWLFVISNILASGIVGVILYYIYKYYYHYVDSERNASQERFDILAQLTDIQSQLLQLQSLQQQLQSFQEQLPQFHLSLNHISETVDSFKSNLADQVRLSQQDYDDLFQRFDPLVENAAPSFQRLQQLEEELKVFRQHFDRTMAQFN